MQNIKKYFMTLALLITAVTGAWADESETITTATKGTTVYTGTHFKITASYICDAHGIYLFSNNNHGTATIESLNGENITKIEMHMTYGGRKATKTTTTEGQLEATNGTEDTNDISVIYVNATSVEIGTTVEASDVTDVQIDKFVIYYGAAAFPFPITWDATNKTTGFSQPAGNVTMNVEYYPVAEFTDGGAPTGIADIKATTDDGIVKAGTVKNIGSSTTPQGTVMYYAVQSATAPTAPDYDATGWTDKVPTATDFAEGNVYVWYYIKGAEPASGTDRTDANTCSDSEITALGTTGYVTLLAAPKYNAEFVFDEGTPDAEKAKWGTNIPDGGVVKGQTVTVTYSGAKKVIGVKAEKKAKGNIVDLSTLTEAYEAQTLDILTGTTSQLITIAAGATVTLKDATVNNQIACSGTATIILADGSTNTVTVTTDTKAGIKIGGTGTLTINGETAGTGTLTAKGGNNAAGIGTSMDETGGNIVINGGTVTATGGSGGAGIGTGDANGSTNTCGAITINGGTVTATGGDNATGIGTGNAYMTLTNTCGAITINGGTVTATGGQNGAGIGTGLTYDSTNECGAITIGTGVTSVTAKKSSSNPGPNSIGIGYKDGGTQTCGTITIGGVVKDQSEFTGATYTYPPSN